MLSSFAAVILGLQRETAIVSCLRSASRLLQRSYHQLEDSSGDRGERWMAKNGSDSETTEDSNSMELECPHSKSGDCDGPHSTTEHSAYGSSKALHEEGAVTLQPPAEGRASTAAQRSGGGVTLLASQALQFIGPFVEEIHQLHCSATVRCLLQDWLTTLVTCLVLAALASVLLCKTPSAFA